MNESHWTGRRVSSAAMAATAVSVVAAFVVEAAAPSARPYLGAAAVLATFAVAVAMRLRPGPRPQPSAEHLFLMVVSLVGAVLVLRSATGWVYDWRLTAAAVTATAPNWYLWAAHLSPRARMNVAGNSSSSL